MITADEPAVGLFLRPVRFISHGLCLESFGIRRRSPADEQVREIPLLLDCTRFIMSSGYHEGLSRLFSAWI